MSRVLIEFRGVPVVISTLIRFGPFNHIISFKVFSFKVIDLPIIDSMHSRPNYLPLSIPEELTSLVSLHGAPIVWFIGQIVGYLMRPSPEMMDYITKQRERFKFKSPIVGIHVRRTDKIGTEAAFHPLSEYMKLVADYFDRLDVFNERNRTVR